MLESDKIELEKLQQNVNRNFLGIMKDHQQILENLCATIQSLEGRIFDLEALLRVEGKAN